MKYLDKVILFDDSIYSVKEDLNFSTIEDAINAAISMKQKYIRIIRESMRYKILTKEMVHDISTFDSKDKLCQYAYERIIYISDDGSEVYGESFDIAIPDDDGNFESWDVYFSMQFSYDYELMYGSNRYKVGDVVQMNGELCIIADKPKNCHDHTNKDDAIILGNDVFYSYYCVIESDWWDFGYPGRANFSSTFTKPTN